MKIQLIDLKRQYGTISEEADKAIVDVLHSAQYIMGENVKSFEAEFADYVGVDHAISCGNGTDALVIALKALGIGAVSYTHLDVYKRQNMPQMGDMML